MNWDAQIDTYAIDTAFSKPHLFCINDEGRIMKTLSELEPILVAYGSSVGDARNWIARIDQLAQRMPKTIAGSARKFSLLHAIDLAIVAALVKAGATPSRAAVTAAGIVRNVKGVGKPSREWLVFPSGDLSRKIASDIPSLDALLKQFGAVPLCMVPIGAVVRAVEKLFEDEYA